MAGRREVGKVVSLLGTSLLLCSGSVAGAADGKGGGFALPCGYAITTILPPDAWGSTVRLFDMNDAGVAVGDYSVSIGNHACIWTKEGGIQPLPEPWWVSESYGVRINNNGWILVNGTGQKVRGYVLIPEPEGGYQIVEIDPASSPGQSKVYGINDKNEVVGLQSMGTRGGTSMYPVGGFKWSEELGKETILVPGYVSTQCNDINDDGVICGVVSQAAQATGATSSRGFILFDGTFEVIEPVTPFTRSDAVRVNNAGTVIGSMRTQGGIGNPSDYDGWRKGIQDSAPVLIPSPDGTWGWWPVDINNQGGIGGRVTVIPGDSGTHHACLVAGDEFTNLTQLLGYTSGTTSFSTLRNDGCILLFGCNCGICGSCLTLLEPVDVFSDLDCDGIVGAKDLALVLGAWGPSVRDVAADLNGDGVVDGADLGIVLSAWTE